MGTDFKSVPLGGKGRHVSVERAALRLFRKFVRFLMDCKLHVGCDPQRVEAPALILFPHRPATLCCGLAGILTLRVAGRVSLETFRLYPSGQTPRGDISILFARAAEKNLPALLRCTMGTEGLMGTDFKSVPIKPSVPVKSLTTYLGGIPTQEAMERELLRMKGEDAFGKIFYDEGEVRRLTHLSEKMKHYESSKVKIVVEKELLGTGGAVINALESLDDRFWLVNGDEYILASDLGRFIEFSKDKPVSLYLTYDDAFDKDVPLLEGGKVNSFFRSSEGKAFVNVGFFSFEKKELKGFENKHMNIEKDIISKLASEGKVHAFKGNGRFFDIGRPERLENFRNVMKDRLKSAKP